MVQTSMTTLGTAIPQTRNNTVEFPQQLSIFFAGSLTPHLGTFIQLTYEAQSDAIGMDNAEIRYASADCPCGKRPDLRTGPE